MGSTRELCTFRCDSILFGMEVTRMREVVRYQETTKVPLAPADVRGLMSLRGQIVPVIDLGVRLDLPANPRSKLPVMLILETQEEPIGLMVDIVEDVITIDEDDIEPPPQNLQGVDRAYVHGLYRLGDRLLVILDADAVTRGGSRLVPS